MSLSPNELHQLLVQVTHVLLGYQVSVEITMACKTSRTVDKGLAQARQANGIATLFGLDIGPSFSTGVVGYNRLTEGSQRRTIPIPPRTVGN